MTTVSMWRWPVSEVKRGKGGAMVEDRGDLKKAHKNAHGWFKLSEHGEGRKPLVVIGTRPQLRTFFQHHGNSGIENSIPELPHIYMGISCYAPRQRERKLTPYNDVAVSVANMAIWTGAGEHMKNSSNLASACGTLYDYVRKVLRPGVEEPSEETDTFCVKFSYLREPGMQVIGRRKVAFGAYEDEIGMKALFGD